MNPSVPMGMSGFSKFDLFEQMVLFQDAIDRVRALHQVETRYVPWPDCEFSYPSAAEAAQEHGVQIDEVSAFDVCAACGEMETGGDETRFYLEALWPCPTIRALDGDPQRSPSSAQVGSSV